MMWIAPSSLPDFARAMAGNAPMRAWIGEQIAKIGVYGRFYETYQDQATRAGRTEHRVDPARDGLVMLRGGLDRRQETLPWEHVAAWLEGGLTQARRAALIQAADAAAGLARQQPPGGSPAPAGDTEQAELRARLRQAIEDAWDAIDAAPPPTAAQLDQAAATYRDMSPVQGSLLDEQPGPGEQPAPARPAAARPARREPRPAPARQGTTARSQHRPPPHRPTPPHRRPGSPASARPGEDAAAATPPINPGRPCGWPGGDCDEDDSLHAAPAGTRRPWGYHDIACQVPNPNPGRHPDGYPACSLIDQHAGDHDYSRADHPAPPPGPAPRQDRPADTPAPGPGTGQPAAARPAPVTAGTGGDPLDGIPATAATRQIIQLAAGAGLRPRPAPAQDPDGPARIILGDDAGTAPSGVIAIGRQSGRILAADLTPAGGGDRQHYTSTARIRDALTAWAAQLASQPAPASPPQPSPPVGPGKPGRRPAIPRLRHPGYAAGRQAGPGPDAGSDQQLQLQLIPPGGTTAGPAPAAGGTAASPGAPPDRAGHQPGPVSGSDLALALHRMTAAQLTGLVRDDSAGAGPGGPSHGPAGLRVRARDSECTLAWPQVRAWIQAGLTPARQQALTRAGRALDRYRALAAAHTLPGTPERRQLQDAAAELERLQAQAAAAIITGALDRHGPGPLPPAAGAAGPLLPGTPGPAEADDAALTRVTQLSDALPAWPPRFRKPLSALVPGDILRHHEHLDAPFTLTAGPDRTGEATTLRGTVHGAGSETTLVLRHHGAGDPQIDLIMPAGGPLARPVSPPAGTAPGPAAADRPASTATPAARARPALPPGGAPENHLGDPDRHHLFWMARARMRQDPGAVITAAADGSRHSYWLDTSEPVITGQPPEHLGHAGRRFIITFHDGRVIETNNLWHHGEIPARFHDLFPVNATVTAAPAGTRPASPARGQALALPAAATPPAALPPPAGPAHEAPEDPVSDTDGPRHLPAQRRAGDLAGQIVDELTAGRPADRWEISYTEPRWPGQQPIIAFHEDSALQTGQRMSRNGDQVDVVHVHGGDSSRRLIGSFVNGQPLAAAAGPVPGRAGTPAEPGEIQPQPADAASGSSFRPHRLVYRDGTPLTCRPDGHFGPSWDGTAAGVFAEPGGGLLQAVRRGDGSLHLMHPAVTAPAGTSPYTGLRNRDRQRFSLFDQAEAAGQPGARLHAALVDIGDMVRAELPGGVLDIREVTAITAGGLRLRITTEGLAADTRTDPYSSRDLIDVAVPQRHPAEDGPGAARLFAPRPYQVGPGTDGSPGQAAVAGRGAAAAGAEQPDTLAGLAARVADLERQLAGLLATAATARTRQLAAQREHGRGAGPPGATRARRRAARLGRGRRSGRAAARRPRRGPGGHRGPAAQPGLAAARRPGRRRAAARR